jgi:hypothetical protein
MEADMATAKLYEHPGTNNPALKQRQADEALAKQQIEEAIVSLANLSSLLYCVRADIASADGTLADETIDSLTFIQQTMKRNVDQLLALT